MDSNRISTVARSVAQLCGSDFVIPSVLLAPPHQQLQLLEIALFVSHNDPLQFNIDVDDTLTVWSPNSQLNSWAPQSQ